MTWTNRESYYGRVVEDSAGITVESAVILAPGGNEQSGVIFRNSGHPKFCITAEAAHRLAVELVDALEQIKQEKSVKRHNGINAAFADLADR